MGCNYSIVRNYLYKTDNLGRRYKILLPPTEIIDNNYSELFDGSLVRIGSTSESTGIDFSLYLQRVNSIINMFPIVSECMQTANKQTGMSHCMISKFPVLAVAFWRNRNENNLRHDWGINTEQLIVKGTHAENLAILSALKQVKRDDFILEAIAVVSPNKEKISSCGECLQAIAEHSPLDYPTIVFGCNHDLTQISVTSLRDLYPKQFPAKNQKEYLEGKAELDSGGNGKKTLEGGGVIVEKFSTVSLSTM